MKAAIFYGRHDLKVEEIQKPQITDDEVLVEVKACGVCGTDVHIFEGSDGAAKVYPPEVLGHEYSGLVVEVGKNVKAYRIGDRVCVDPNMYCGKCEPCRDGKVHFCENMLSYGVTLKGGFAQYSAVNERQVYKLGDNTNYIAGAMTEPLACCLHGIDMCGIKQGEKVVIVGAGLIGLLMLQLATISGASAVAVLEPSSDKRAQAKNLGAALCIDPIKEDAKKILSENGFADVQVVIECVGKTQTIENAISIVGKGGTVMMFGLTTPDATISVKPFEVFQKEIVLKSSFINPLTQKRALELIDAKKVDVESMVCATCSLDELEEVLKSEELRAKGKYVVCP